MSMLIYRTARRAQNIMKWKTLPLATWRKMSPFLVPRHFAKVIKSFLSSTLIQRSLSFLLQLSQGDWESIHHPEYAKERFYCVR